MPNTDFTHLSSSDNTYIDALYEEFKNGGVVDETWNNFFKGFDFAVAKHPEIENADANNAQSSGTSTGNLDKEFRVFRIIQSYRARGDLLAKTNPIRDRLDRKAYLRLEDYGLSDADLDKTFACGEYLDLGKTTLRKIIQHMEQVYCKSLGIEFMHIQNTEMRRWFRDRIEKDKGLVNFPQDKKKRILEKLNESVVFENFLNTKYVGQKRFSLEGGENTIPALDAIINLAGDIGVNEVVIGMAHRGRLNVLANTLGKTYEYIFDEFEGNIDPNAIYGDGDVKYHLGFTSQAKTRSGNNVFLKLMPNPSHLEAVGPVVQGYCRAQTDILYKEDNKKVLPIIIHGDAAVAGQGIVYEATQMSQLPGYDVGGTIHFVINNQIGFTTNFADARSSSYCTSVARVINLPVIHVNGDDAEAVVYAVELATEFRQEFGQDIFIDMVCYRRHGHNEGDEPKYTQPKMYNIIEKHPTPREVYIQKLIEGKSIDTALVKEMETKFKDLLQNRFNMVKQKEVKYTPQAPDREWKDLKRAEVEDFDYSPKTGFEKKRLEKVYQALITVADDIKPFKKTARILADRKKRWENDNLDWAMAELLGYGSLLMDGIAIRMSGQDCIRGTFSHRHAGIMDETGEKTHFGLNHISKDQAKFRIYNSLLSEYAVLGFEYGYSLGRPTDINIWEAQFGDFCNGAQTIFDQFISSGESKWNRMSGLLVYLPHGYEGQGPEHSSAKIERFLQLAANKNMIIANCTTPANFFHLLRRHITWNFRKPIILFTPKSLLRHPGCVSKIADLTDGNFKEIIDDSENIKNPKRMLMCSGKIYYDLKKYRDENKVTDVAIVRLEQLYPMSEKGITEILAKYKNSEKVWVQEEPKNMGAWTYLMRFDEFQEFKLISRRSSASPATGYAKVHKEEQEKIISLSFE